MPPNAHPFRGAAAALAAALMTFFAEPSSIAAMSASPDADALARARTQLLAEIEQDVRETRHHLGFDRLDPAVLEAIGKVPRERFVPPGLRHQAYRNSPLPIGGGQTISQPYIVAIMSHLLQLPPDGGRVFELGTGSGYQAAVLGAMGAEVYSVEIVPELAERAQAIIGEIGYDNVHIRAGDGFLGWPEAAPFDGIIVTAAGPEIPQPLIEQLKVGGRLVMPVGGADAPQELVVLTKEADGRLQRREVLPVRFVPITGDRVSD